MGRLSSDQVLKDNNATDSTSISTLKLNLRAISDVSCLKDFKNLQRLDLGFNSLTSLEDLRPCVNLKWLSVVQNKLQSLRGIEGLSKLTVLNAGKNKLTSMDEVMSLVGLRALILNDNEITSICKLDQMKELNTLVLSRNPVREIGKSLVKVKSMTKLSLSNCELQAIDSSLKSCVELKELRLAHNHIKVLPAELCNNTKLQNLDLGNNSITSWSDLKVLKSLVNLRNLNLLGNPITDNEKSAKKIRRVLPNLQIFNTKPVNKSSTDKVRDIEPVDELLDAADDVKGPEIGGYDKIMGKKSKLQFEDDENNDDDANGQQPEKEKKWKRQKSKDALPKEDIQAPQSKLQFEDDENDDDDDDDDDANGRQPEKEKKWKRQKLKDALPKEDVRAPQLDDTTAEKKMKKPKKAMTRELDVIDDGEAAFAEVSEAGRRDNPEDVSDKGIGRTLEQVQPDNVSHPAKKKKSRKRGVDPAELMSLTIEVGMGGPSTWDD